MPTRIETMLRTAAATALLALAACGGGGGENDLAALDNELLANGADPALTSALEDQILVDPNLVQQAHPNAVRPPETPVQAQYPAGSAAQASGQAERSGEAGQGGQTRVRRAAAVRPRSRRERRDCDNIRAPGQPDRH